MVVLGYANITNTAVLASGGFEKKASAAEVSWLIQYVVIWVPFHFLLVILRSDDGRRGSHSFVSEDIWYAAQYEGRNLVYVAQTQEGR